MTKLNDVLNTVAQGDCIEIMRGMADNSVDLVLTDPPYGIDFNSNMSKNPEYRAKLKSVDGINNDGTDNTDFLASVMAEIDRVLKPNAHVYWFTRWDRVQHQQPLLEQYFNVKNAMVWDKGSGSMGDLLGSYAGNYETILFAQKGRRLLNEVDGNKRHPDIIKVNKVPAMKLRHSHEKPEELIEFLIRKSSDAGETILDPFCGSGTTAVCAKRLGRNFVTMELDGDYVNIANERLAGVAQS